MKDELDTNIFIKIGDIMIVRWSSLIARQAYKLKILVFNTSFTIKIIFVCLNF